MTRSLHLRRLAHGLVAGALLACLRAPLGLDWTQLAVVQGSSAALFRAAALLALVLSLDPARAALRAGLGPAWLSAVALGFVLEAFVLELVPGSRAGYALTLLVLTVALRALAGKAARGDGGDARLERGERLGLLLAGLGAAVALESLAREVRLFTMATRADEALVAAVWLLLVALGAAAFGPLLARLADERARAIPGLALVAGASAAGMLFLAQLTAPGLHGYLRRIEGWLSGLRALDEHLGGALGLHGTPTLDGASIGTFWATALLAAAALIVPGFALGATLGAARHAGRVRHALAGAALGLVLLPSVIQAHARPLDLEAAGTVAFGWELVVAGTSLAAVGVFVAGLGPGRPRLGALALALVLAALPWIRPRIVLWSVSPWAAARVEPELLWPTPEGLLTVERARDGARILTLDRRRLTPIRDEEAGEARRIRRAFALLPAGVRARAVRVLFVGQLTPGRARALAELGTLELERTALWHAAMERVDALLFGGGAAPGRIVAPSAARARLADGDYDLVLSLPVRGPVITWKSEARDLWGSSEMPGLTDLELEDDTLGVAWLAADALAARGSALGPLLVDVERMDSLHLGLVRGALDAAAPAHEPRFESRDFSGPGPLAFLRTMPQQRQFVLEAAWAAGLDPAPAPALARGLALHFAAQRLSNPYESRSGQVELDEDALRAFLQAVPPPGALDELARELWEALAAVLTEKREPELVLVYVEPVAERFAAWPALDLAVARAYLELLEPEEAARLLARARGARPNDAELWLESARCAEELGDHAAAAEALERAYALRPERPELERALGLALLRHGEPRGREIVERFLRAYPDDRELAEALGLFQSPDAAGER
jgi:tetratricopeptide (TPR) repeat protein